MGMMMMMMMMMMMVVLMVRIVFHQNRWAGTDHARALRSRSSSAAWGGLNSTAEEHDDIRPEIVG